MDAATLYQTLSTSTTPVSHLYKRVVHPTAGVDTLYVSVRLFTDTVWLQLGISTVLDTSNYLGVVQTYINSQQVKCYVFTMVDQMQSTRRLKLNTPTNRGRLEHAKALQLNNIIKSLRSKKGAGFYSRSPLPALDAFIKAHHTQFHRDIDTVVAQTDTLVPYTENTLKNKELGKKAIGLIYKRGGAKYIIDNDPTKSIDFVYIRITALTVVGEGRPADESSSEEIPITNPTSIQISIPYKTDSRYLYTETKTIAGHIAQVAVFDMQARSEVCPCCGAGRRRREDEGIEVQHDRRVQRKKTGKKTGKKTEARPTITVPQYLRSTPPDILKEETITCISTDPADDVDTKHLYIQVAALKQANVTYLSDRRYIGKRLKRFPDKAYYCAVFNLSI
jgi:hypothetical protein